MIPLSEKIINLISDIGQRRSVRSRDSIENFHEWVTQSPKIETHVHLEAAVDVSFYQSLQQPEHWKQLSPWHRGPFPDLRSFIMAWVDLSRAIRKIEDFEALACAFVQARVKENIRYTEAYFSPADFTFMRKRFSIAPEVFSFDEVLAAYVRGLKRGLIENPGYEVRLIMDALWPSHRTERQIMSDALHASLSDPHFFDAQGQRLIIGIGLGGLESHHDLAGHFEFIQDVRGMGFKVDIHSGEGTDANLHRKSVEFLSPDRVSHGFSGIREGFLFSQNVVMCPISNIFLGTFAGRPEEHPVFSLLRDGVPISIGSDDPLLLGHNLSSEYAFLYAVESSFSEEMFWRIQENTRSRVLDPDVCSRVIDFKT